MSNNPLCGVLRYNNLLAQYGRLEPLADVDLRPQSSILMDVRCGERVERLSLRLDQTVAELKRTLRPVVQLPCSKMRVYHVAPALGTQELKYGGRALHSYQMREGEEILVVPKDL